MYSPGYHFHRKGFYAKGRHWLFYQDTGGGGILFRTSIDGKVWSDATWVRAGNPPSFSAVYDGVDHVHAAWAQASNLFYRRGFLNEDGTITWQPWQTAYAVGGIDCNWPIIDVDSGGFPWIGWQRHDIAGVTYRPWVTKSSRNDGVWATDVGFPYQLSIISGGNVFAMPVALTGLRVCCLYGNHLDIVRCQLYDGGWGAEENCSVSLSWLPGMSTGEGDDVHLIWRTRVGPNYSIRYARRVWGVGWTAEEEVYQVAHYTAPIITVDAELGIVYVLWTSNGTIFFRRNVNGVWDADNVAWAQNEGPFAEGGGNKAEMNVFPEAQERFLGVVWVSGDVAPYDLRYDVLVLLPSSLKTARAL